MNRRVTSDRAGRAAVLRVPGTARRTVTIVVALLAGCGGGGDGEPIVRDSTLLAAYRFEVRHDADAVAPLRVETQWGPTSRVFSMSFDEGAGLMGRYESSNGVASMEQGAIFAADTGGATPAIDAFRAVVTADIIMAPTGGFASGAWDVRFGTDTVTVTVVSNPAAGVALSLNGAPTQFFAWPEFQRLFSPGSAAPPWQQAASASLYFLQLTLSQVRMSFVALRDATDAAFRNTALSRNCSRFPVAPPTGVLNQGERVMTWLGSANQGFDLRFTDCWDDAAGDSQDYLYRGAVALSGWRAANDAANRLVFLGFGGDEFGARVPGGVTYRGLALDRTMAAGAGGHLLDVDHAHALSGSVAIGFQEP